MFLYDNIIGALKKIIIKTFTLFVCIINSIFKIIAIELFFSTFYYFTFYCIFTFSAVTLRKILFLLIH